ncbi:MAG: 3-oxoacid CoA-transferase subunit B [Clostridiales Family XIII bacterium]|jgi:acetate CoA/acetoacetate CoA-transferase beta subunit|nr:3-oxoacid CoA-transferase subunit B [Clostridiales Family XIII bacterium]
MADSVKKDTRDPKVIIATRAAQEMQDGYVVNLGIGLPVLVANYLPEGVEVFLQSENGMMGMGPAPEKGSEDIDVTNAGGTCVTMEPFAMCFDSSYSFGLIRGGHVDATVLGALEVDCKGNIANWIVPGKLVPGMGGAMDLVVGANKVIVGMLHTQVVKDKETGEVKRIDKKILKECSLPLTAVGVVDMIITEMGVMELRPEGLVLTELHPDYTLEDILTATDAELIVSPDLKPMPIPA